MEEEDELLKAIPPKAHPYMAPAPAAKSYNHGQIGEYGVSVQVTHHFINQLFIQQQRAACQQDYPTGRIRAGSTAQASGGRAGLGVRLGDLGVSLHFDHFMGEAEALERESRQYQANEFFQGADELHGVMRAAPIASAMTAAVGAR